MSDGERPRRERGAGSIYPRGKRWWIAYHVRGKLFREPGGDTEKDAKNKLKERMKEIHGDRFVGPKEERLSIDELCDNLVVHLETKGARSVEDYVTHLKPVRAALGLTRVVDLTTTHTERFIQERLGAGKASATVNRET